MRILLSIFIFISVSFIISGCSNKKIENQNNGLNTADNDTIIVDISTNIKDNNDKKDEEKEISNFQTPLTSGVANRITNIKITCNKINGRTLAKGETFSFNDLIGPCTAEEGYKEAEIYVNKQIKYALGGGNCQVSTTLYNAALAVPGISIVERHEHGRSVDYIEDGKDATVSYDTLDLKFKNDTDTDLKLYTWCDDVNVYAKICSK